MKKNKPTETKPNEFVFIKPLKVGKTKNGNLLIYLNNTTGLSFHPNFIQAVLTNQKKAS